MTDKLEARAREVLERQLTSALEVDAAFCVACGQPDEPDLHDDARCPAMGGVRDALTIAEAVGVFDASCEALPDIEDEARALHCAMLAFNDALSPQASADDVERVEDALEIYDALQHVETVYVASGIRDDTSAPFNWYVIGPEGEVAYCQMEDGQRHAEMIAAALNDRVAMCKPRAAIAAMRPADGDGARAQGQQEGWAAAVQWLRDRSAQRPPASLHDAASTLADQLEAARISMVAPSATTEGEGS